MTKENRNGCYAEIKDHVLHIGNGTSDFQLENAENLTVWTDDHHGLSVPYLRILADMEGGKREFHVWDGLSAVEFTDWRGVFSLPLRGEHWTMRAVRLYDATDHFDTLTSDTVFHMFRGNLPECEGNIFFLEDPESEKAVVFISCAPDFVTAHCRAEGGTLLFDGESQTFVLGFCRTGECEKLVRAWCRKEWRPTALTAMSNTWGDRNGTSRVRDDFVRREIDSAEKIGIDIVQIDDGWQTGDSSDPQIRDRDNRRMFLGNFWDLDTERFPDGIAPLTAYAENRGLRLGLWFAPDSRNGFELLERDKAVLRKAHDEWGARYFKLDMISILSETDRTAMLDLLDTVTGFGPGVSVELDVTLGKRMGYLGALRYGTLFVENRYTLSGNSFPHRVLRNLWMLSRYIPAAKFQFELVNPDLNTGCYHEDDIFAPAHYEMDYLFAVTMFSNPLFWMEMQFLSAKRREELSRILPVWWEYREALAKADVCPVGEKPGGRSLTGFCAVGDGGNGEDVYLLLFREATERAAGNYTLPFAVDDVRILGENGNASCRTDGCSLSVTFSHEKTYVFIRAKKAER